MAGDDLDDQLDYAYDSSPDSPRDISVDLEQSDTEQVVAGQVQAAKAEDSAPKPSKRSLKKKNQTKKDEKRANMEATIEKKKQLGRREPAVIADYIASSLATKKELSALEIQDQSVAQASIEDTSEWQGERVLSRLAVFVKNFDIVRDGELAVVLNISAIRACDACRALRTLQMPVGKLIPKNKPKQDEDLLAKKPKLVVATPGRIRRLVADKILDPTRVARVVVEGSFIDTKANSVFDLPETIEVLNTLTTAGAKLYVY